MILTGSKVMVKSLEMEGVEVVFGYPGAAICPFYDALLDSGIRHILTRHEQGAAHAASGYARVTGKMGVCIATSGPGATNLITGIATAYMDSIPMVAITGQVSSELIGRDVFQEVDITGAAAPFCKHSYLVKDTGELPRVIKEAFHIASTGRPGPVLIDVPIDVQLREIDFKYPETVDIKGYKPTYKGHMMQIKKIADAVKKAKAPVICAGGGVIYADASEELKKLVESCRIPVTTTLMGIGVIPSGHELNMGMLGSHGVFAANYAIHNADLVIIMGARVGDRAMATADKVAEKAQIVHIDIDPAEIGKNIDVTIPVVGDVKLILEELLQIAEPGDTSKWVQDIKEIKNAHPLRNRSCGDYSHVKPQYVLSLLSELVGEDDVVTTEVGQNQIWTANYFQVKKPRGLITSGGLGTMGYGLPAGVGAKIGRPDAKVIVIGGDGSFQMSIQELGTIKQNKLGVKIIIFNNSRLGMVRELQKLKYCGRYSQVLLEENPDFVKLVEAYGFKGERITSNYEVEEALKRLLKDDGAYLLECIVDPEESTL
ncbi:acetolactate synthase large subunit [Anaerobacterium chartisolvens]|uniref:Acetolactate synthase n=1 Tax=Anaerobacterium chartisolvens TaxID=1297424 RepID=A0A369AVI2_9FIRM|nr:biosynthetic-type acetolactate synthase large subunit [Anaerobacterium chartisolvens]RCX13201.1 acetolactate synthase large subunit [Anaerobacterium chartisolvens]